MVFTKMNVVLFRPEISHYHILVSRRYRSETYTGSHQEFRAGHPDPISVQAEYR